MLTVERQHSPSTLALIVARVPSAPTLASAVIALAALLEGWSILLQCLEGS